jgi:hypothetical protein
MARRASDPTARAGDAVTHHAQARTRAPIDATQERPRRGLPGARAFVHAVERPHAVTRPVLVVQTRLPAPCEARGRAPLSAAACPLALSAPKRQAARPRRAAGSGWRAEPKRPTGEDIEHVPGRALRKHCRRQMNVSLQHPATPPAHASCATRAWEERRHVGQQRSPRLQWMQRSFARGGQEVGGTMHAPRVALALVLRRRRKVQRAGHVRGPVPVLPARVYEVQVVASNLRAGAWLGLVVDDRAVGAVAAVPRRQHPRGWPSPGPTRLRGCAWRVQARLRETVGAASVEGSGLPQGTSWAPRDGVEGERHEAVLRPPERL